ncbi:MULTISPECIES: DUF493 family protein [unclassified Halobacteriovorax]|uniref:DUF493 domain-containing protein n=2 Tax=Halobacteriovoraceae TaxID=1652132 RepID=A0ABY0IIE4_9BACT|nr:DUF493 family protein [Halobacteriovorax sp. BALOs_7]AYF45139.1 PF04359 family protein [Halobacteriovorax sp. BALOs_7]RZF22235.1 DUF493 domain-containing protein [Halobacteriovorax vibrionivorans]TGD48487.1 DUF493 domain-containing protein [Halobacteriovorax sp. Y22]
MDMEKLKGLLNDQYDWPAEYNFKFIGNDSNRDELIMAVGAEPHHERPSKTGKYISFTFNVKCNSADEVLTIYERVSRLHGIMSL